MQLRWTRQQSCSVPLAPRLLQVHSALKDVDGDGDTDMILDFNTQATDIQCGDTSASLTGETFSGQMIQGSDSVKRRAVSKRFTLRLAMADNKLLDATLDKVFMSRCYGITRNLHRCSRRGDWKLFCHEHKKQPLVGLYVLIFTVGGTASIYLTSRKKWEVGRGMASSRQSNKRGSLVRSKRNRNPVRKSGLVVAGSEEACVLAGQLLNFFREAGWLVQAIKLKE